MSRMHNLSDTRPSCAICGSDLLELKLGAVERCGCMYSVYYCRECRIGVTWPRPDDETLVRLYSPGEYRADEGKRFVGPIEFLFELHKKWLIHRISSSMKAGRMLDVGCGSGFLASLFANAGWDVTGIERDDMTAMHARETYRIPVVTDIDHVTGTFDLIMVNHVLEHLEQPLQFLEKCREQLAPGGRVIVAVPNFSSFQAFVGREGWFHLDLPLHLFHFSEQGLKVLMERAGLRVVDVSHADWIQNLYGWLQTLLNCAGIPHNTLYNFLRVKSRNEKLPKLALAASLVSCIVVVPLTLFGLLAERLCRTGGVVRCSAVNEEYVAEREDMSCAE